MKLLQTLESLFSSHSAEELLILKAAMEFVAGDEVAALHNLLAGLKAFFPPAAASKVDTVIARLVAAGLPAAAVQPAAVALAGTAPEA